jgi:LysM repeat protein
VVGAALVLVLMRVTGASTKGGASGPTATITLTPTVTPTPTDAPTSTPVPTATLEPAIDYTVRSGDVCSSIALTFNVSVQSLIVLNNLSANCTLSVGDKLKVPHPTPTPAAQATSTMDAAHSTIEACNKVSYTVQSGDSLSSIATNYNVPAAEIKSFNGLSNDSVFIGNSIWIPLCKRAATPGPTFTPTIPPPYPAPPLLLPVDGTGFTLADTSITLQWASIGTLRSNESYVVTVVDVTDSQGLTDTSQARRLVEYVTDTKFIIPADFRPKDNRAHILRWWVSTVRQNGSDDQGQPVWVSAGALSLQRDFSWQGIAPEVTPTP